MKLTKEWFFGFIETNGFFDINIVFDNNNSSLKVVCEFKIFIPNLHDYAILKGFLFIFKGIGRITNNYFIVDDFNALLYYIIPFFDGNSLKSTKRLEFIKFRRAVFFLKKRSNCLNIKDLEFLCKLQEDILRFRFNLSKDKVQKS